MGSTAVTGAHLLQRVLQSALEAEEGTPVAQWPRIPEEAQGEFVQAVLRHRVVAVIAPIVERVALSESWQARLSDAHSHDVLDSMRLQSTAATVYGALTEAGIRSLAYKGVALAAQTTSDPSARGFGDLDILVSPTDVPLAHRVLLQLGASPVPGYVPEPGSPLWPAARRIGCEAPYRLRGVELDLHWRFDRIPQIARIPFEDLWQRRTAVELAGRRVPTLGATDALLVTCVHGTKEHWHQWRWVVDVVRQLRNVPAESWIDVRDRARLTGCEDGLAVGIAISRHLSQSLGPLCPGPRAHTLADQAWKRAMEDSSPFGHITPRKQFARLGWTVRTLPSRRSTGSILVRTAWSNLDLAQLPLPRALVWIYPVLRPALWLRRFRGGRYTIDSASDGLAAT